MTWNLAGSWLIEDRQQLIDETFNSRLAVAVSSVSGLKPTWIFAGYFYQMVDIPVVGLSCIDKKIATSIRNPIIFTPQQTYLPYQLRYQKAEWIDSLILTIYEDSMPLYGTPDPVIFPNTKITNSVATTVPPATTSAQVLAANTNRKKFVISNLTNQILYIELSGAASVVTATISIPPKTASGNVYTYEDDDWNGTVSVISPVTASGSIQVREMT